MKKIFAVFLIVNIIISCFVPIQAKEGDSFTDLATNNVTKVFETEGVFKLRK